MSPVIEDTISRIVREMVKRDTVRCIIVFGSQARGDASLDSDLDLLVVEDQSFGVGSDRRAELSQLRKALRGIEMPVDLLLYSQDEMDRWAGSLNHVVAMALKEGKVIYER